MRWNYGGLSLDDKFRTTDTWKERVLLLQVRELQVRLEESEILGSIQRKRRRSELGSDDDIEHVEKRCKLEDGARSQSARWTRRRSNPPSENVMANTEKRAKTLS